MQRTAGLHKRAPMQGQSYNLRHDLGELRLSKPGIQTQQRALKPSCDQWLPLGLAVWLQCLGWHMGVTELKEQL